MLCLKFRYQFIERKLQVSGGGHAELGGAHTCAEEAEANNADGGFSREIGSLFCQILIRSPVSRAS